MSICIWQKLPQPCFPRWCYSVPPRPQQTCAYSSVKEDGPVKLDRHSQLEGFAVGPGRNKHKHQQKQLEFSTRNYNSGARDQNLAFPQTENLRRDYFRAICIWQSSLCHCSGPVAHHFYSPLEESAAMISRPPSPAHHRRMGHKGAGGCGCWALGCCLPTTLGSCTPSSSPTSQTAAWPGPSRPPRCPHAV